MTKRNKLEIAAENAFFVRKEEIKGIFASQITALFLQEKIGLYEYKTYRDFLNYEPNPDIYFFNDGSIEILYGKNLERNLVNLILSFSFDYIYKKVGGDYLSKYLSDLHPGFNRKEEYTKKALYNFYKTVVSPNILRLKNNFYEELKKEKFITVLELGAKTNQNKEKWNKEKLRRMNM